MSFKGKILSIKYFDKSGIGKDKIIDNPIKIKAKIKYDLNFKLNFKNLLTFFIS
jgi:hypothetical protein